MNYIMICKELSWDTDEDSELYYYKVSEKFKENAKESNFIYILNEGIEARTVEIYEITKFIDAESCICEHKITTLSDNSGIHLVSEQYFIVPKSDFLTKHYKDTIRELRKSVNIIIKALKTEMFFSRITPLSDERKDYLLKLFYDKNGGIFCEKSNKYKNQWFKQFNNFELDFVHIINLFKLKSTISQFIKKNKTIDITEKDVFKMECFDRLKLIASTINTKGLIRFKFDSEIGLDISLDGKDIILGKFTKLELHLNFFSFWNIIKSLLTASFIPLLILLLRSNQKIIIYFLLGIIYLIVSILSDENQIGNIINFINQINESKSEQSSYSELFYIGIISVLIFIIFSIQVACIPNVTYNIQDAVLYLMSDFLLALTTLVIILMLIELIVWLIIATLSSMIYIKRFKKFSRLLCSLFNIAFWSISDYCIYNVLNIKKYFNGQTFNWEMVVFLIATIMAFMKIWQNVIEFKEEVRNRFSKS